MKARFVLDESSWAGAAGIAPPEVLTDAMERLLARLDVARDRSEGVVKHAEFYEIDLGDGVQLFSLLFDPGCALHVDRDLATRMSLALDRTSEFNDSRLTEYDAVVDGSARFAPGVAWAHTSCREGCHIAVFPLALGGESPVGTVPVTVADATLEMFFVAEESQHVDFFRSVITLENAGEAKFESLAPSAFPALKWADNVWRGLRDFSRPYIAVRRELVRSLGGLSDHGTACFEEFRAADPRQLPSALSARVGAEVSDENGRTKEHSQSRRDRTRRHRGTDKVFWWHVKLQPHVDRIHFLYEEPAAGVTGPGESHIVVGLFTDHCVLP